MSNNEREVARRIAEMWLDGRLSPLTQKVPMDPDCDACVLARQYVRALEEIERLRSLAGAVTQGPDFADIIGKVGRTKPPTG